MRQIILLSIISVKVVAQVCFNNPLHFNTGVGGSPSMALEDFNSDGKPDLILSGNSYISLLKGNGSGNFNTPVLFPGATGTGFVCSHDFNHDGKKDVAVVTGLSNNLSILLGTGTGSFVTAFSYSLGSNPSSVCHGDFNNDGEIDLAISNRNSNSVLTLKGAGDGSFSYYASSTTGSQPLYILSKDFNNDGIQDLATANFAGTDVSLLFGDGVGSFSAPVNFSAGNSPNSLASGNLNGDNFVDLVVTNAASNSVSVLLGAGNGSFAPAVNYTLATTLRGVTITDLNNDGKSDFCVGVNSASKITIFIGNGTGNFTTHYDITSPYPGITLMAADLNGDSKQDVITSGVDVHLNDPIKVNGTSVICSGTSTTFTLSGVNTYTWTGSTGSINTTTIYINPSTSTIYTVSGTLNSCTYSKTVSVFVRPTPTITINASSNPICIGGSATLTAQGADTYTWGALPGSPNSPTVAVTPTTTNSTSYWVGGANIGPDYTCYSGTSFYLVQNQLIYSNERYKLPCQNTSDGTYTISPFGGTSPYIFTSSAQSSTTTANSLIIDNLSSSSSFTYSIKDQNNCTYISSPISLPDAPPLFVNVTHTNVCAGTDGAINLTPTADSIPYTYQWSLPGQHNPTVQNLSPGLYSYTVSGGQYGCINFGSIQLDAAPVVMLAPWNQAPHCGEEVTISSSSSFPLMSYQWTPTVGVSSPNSLNTTLSPTISNQYTLTTYYQGCSKTYPINMQVSYPSNFAYTTNSLSVTFSMNDVPYCTGVGYLWDFGNGMQNTVAPNPSVTYSAPGLYTACLKCGSVPQACVACTTFSLPVNTSGGTDVGIIEISNVSNALRVYPVPSNGLFFIETENECIIDIMNVLGEKMLSRKLHIGKNEIDLSHQSNGIYFVRHNHSTFKIIKQ